MSIPQLPFKKIIRDPIHGYIELTQTEYELIQLPVLMRLHNIHHMGMGYFVYPGATTSRFEHSLGVMNIVSGMIYRILQNADSKVLNLFGLDPENREGFKEGCCKIIRMVRLAALLHDIGQGPYSHTSEPILREAIDQKGELSKALELFKCGKKEELPAHEYFSFKIINESKEIKNIVEKIEIETKDIAVLLNKKVESNCAVSENGIRLLRKLISSQLDADRMDYLLRDAHATGVPFGLTDIDRIIMHFRIVRDKMGNYELAINERALMCIEDFMDARFKMYKWVYNHHLKVAMEELMRSAIRSMIDNKTLNWEEFHWTTFEKGKTDDAYVISKIAENQDTLAAFKGLIDRRYAPISLLKRPEDHRNIELSIMEITGKITTIESVRDKIRKILEKREIEIPETELGEKLKGMELFGVNKPISPYKELNGEEKIWIYSKKDLETRLKDLTLVSTYAEAINEEIKEFPSYYISFVVPSVPKSEIEKSEKENIKSLIVKIFAQAR